MSSGTAQKAARRAARQALVEDLAGLGDVTGRAFAGVGQASVVAREAGVLSGSLPFTEAARLVDGRLDVRFAFTDGAPFAAGNTVATVAGALADVPQPHRPRLPGSHILSGVATCGPVWPSERTGAPRRDARTTQVCGRSRSRPSCHGGGLPHRSGLYDAALVKDNHVRAAGGVAAAVKLVRAGLPPTHTLEVEVDDLEQLEEALGAGVGFVLLDNMGLETVREAVRIVAGRCTLEVSGGVLLPDVRDIAATGVDIISVGALTTRAPWIDMSLDLE